MVQDGACFKGVRRPELLHDPTKKFRCVCAVRMVSYRKNNCINAISTQKGERQMIVLDYRDRRPLYEQVTERFKELIVREILPQDAQLPSVRSLASELSINPNTIQRAYAELERQGYIYSVKGKGSFVAEKSRIRLQAVGEWWELFEDTAAQGLDMGIEQEEMTERIGQLARERGQEKGGESHD